MSALGASRRVAAVARPRVEAFWAAACRGAPQAGEHPIEPQEYTSANKVLISEQLDPYVNFATSPRAADRHIGPGIPAHDADRGDHPAPWRFVRRRSTRRGGV